MHQLYITKYQLHIHSISTVYQWCVNNQLCIDQVSTISVFVSWACTMNHQYINSMQAVHKQCINCTSTASAYKLHVKCMLPACELDINYVSPTSPLCINAHLHLSLLGRQLHAQNSHLAQRSTCRHWALTIKWVQAVMSTMYQNCINYISTTCNWISTIKWI